MAQTIDPSLMPRKAADRNGEKQPETGKSEWLAFLLDYAIIMASFAGYNGGADAKETWVSTFCFTITNIILC